MPQDPQIGPHSTLGRERFFPLHDDFRSSRKILDVHNNDAGSRHHLCLVDGQLDGTDRCGRAISGYEDLHDFNSR